MNTISQDTAYSILVFLFILIAATASVALFMWYWQNRDHVSERISRVRNRSRRQSEGTRDERQAAIENVVAKVKGSYEGGENEDFEPITPSNTGYKFLGAGILSYILPTVKMLFMINAPIQYVPWQFHLLFFVAIVIVIGYALMFFGHRERQGILSIAGFMMIVQSLMLTCASASLV